MSNSSFIVGSWGFAAEAARTAGERVEPPRRPTLPAAKRPGRTIRASYDAAATTDENSRHWSNADSFSARRANSEGVRTRIRNRARYEVANNCYARGLVNTLADLVVGEGPRLFLPRRGELARALRTRPDRRPGEAAQRVIEQDEANRRVERLFHEWADSIGLWATLWTARAAKAQDGEAFLLLRSNPSVDAVVQLDVQGIEADQVTHGVRASFSAAEVDGVEVDDFGRVIGYYVLPEHPGDETYTSALQEPTLISARAVCHWYRVDRPGQLRGVSELTPALPLFAQLRRFTLATLSAAEWAASVSALVSTELPPDEETLTEPWERIEFERNALMTMPDGTRMSQLKAEHPTTTFDAFRDAILVEAGRCVGLSRARVLGDSSKYNYASGRLDYQGDQRMAEVDQRSCVRQVLWKIWDAWQAEAALIPGYLPAGWSGYGLRPEWLWRQLGHVDRSKEAAGQTVELENNTTTLARECARFGQDWEEVLLQRAAELSRMRELGLSTGTGAAESGNQAAEQEEEETEDAEA